MRRLIVALILSMSITAGCAPAAVAAGNPRPSEHAAPYKATTPTTPPTPTTTTPAQAAAEKRQHEINVYLWYYELNKQAEFARALAALAAALRAPHPDHAGRIMGSGRCGGILPSCDNLRHESGGFINIYYGGKTWQLFSCCSASGKWMFVRGTWANFMGYRNAADAPEWVQDRKAAEVWDHGRGCGHWSCRR